MKFDEDVWKEQIIPFVRTAFAEEKEYVSQLCKKDGKVFLGQSVSANPRLFKGGIQPKSIYVW